MNQRVHFPKYPRLLWGAVNDLAMTRKGDFFSNLQ